MSHQGRPRLRTLLYFSCLRMVQYDTHFAQLYAYLQRRKDNPLTKMQAVGVLMNKLLHIWWALIQNQTFYNPSFGQSSLKTDLFLFRSSCNRLSVEIWRCLATRGHRTIP